MSWHVENAYKARHVAPKKTGHVAPMKDLIKKKKPRDK